MRKIGYLIIAIIGNALGTALMANTYVGMTAWGSSAHNMGNFLNVTLGNGFIILSVFFYILAIIINKKFHIWPMIHSMIFLFSFAYLSDVFVLLFPNFEEIGYSLVVRLLINVGGMLILMFSIALHLRVHIAVHPMDVFLHAVQQKIGIAWGTYLSYFIGLALAVIFGLLNDKGIENVGIVTLITVLSSGLVMKFFNVYILDKWKI